MSACASGVPAELEQRAGQRDARIDEDRSAVRHRPAETANGLGRLVGQQPLLAGAHESLGARHPGGLVAVAASWFISAAAAA